MRGILASAVIVGGLLTVLGCGAREDERPRDTEGTPTPLPAAETACATAAPIHGLELKDIGRQAVSLAEYRGRAPLLVNVASGRGYTRRHAGLEALNARYAEQGLVVMGFPADNFGGQEPGTNAEIRQFCTDNFRVSFAMFAKIPVKGDDMHPLYRYLTDGASNPGFGGPIPWNFTKFLVARDGRILGRYAPSVEPLSDPLVKDVEAALTARGGS